MWSTTRLMELVCQVALGLDIGGAGPQSATTAPAADDHRGAVRGGPEVAHHVGDRDVHDTGVHQLEHARERHRERDQVARTIDRLARKGRRAGRQRQSGHGGVVSGW